MFKVVSTIPSPEEVRNILPLSFNLKKIKAERDSVLSGIFSGSDRRFLLIVGPCSADDEITVCDYVSRLSRVAEKVNDKLFIVPRIYTTKPRTRGQGYMGVLHNPNPTFNANIRDGVVAMRRMHVKAAEESGLTAADEMLYPENYAYLDDLLSYVAVGARSSENQQHRLVASGISVPVGVKNPISGSLSVLANSVCAAQSKGDFQYRGKWVKTSGNEYAHAVLRGSVDDKGNAHPNYGSEYIRRLYELFREIKIKNPAVIVDTNHGNSGKNPDLQEKIVNDVLSVMKADNLGTFVKGFLIESYIEDGCQPIGGGVYGKSITDPCLGWEKTERLILSIAEAL